MNYPNLSDLIHITPKRFQDHRGFFSETYSSKYYKSLGVDVDFVQDNYSFSIKMGTLRGLHFQSSLSPQAKLVTCIQGSIFDVAVDIRMGSPSYGKWAGYELSAENGHQLFVPIGFAHGFLTLKENTGVIYKCSNYYNPESEGSLLWSDPEIEIFWPTIENLILSEKDNKAPLLRDFQTPFIYGVNS